jgi:maleylacetoacetate isomerase/maleylpyruvate isomerase
MKLHGYYRSSTSYRLRIALELKGIAFDNLPVNLLRAEQRGEAFSRRNPFATVPMLEADGRDRAQSMAIIEWLDEAYPDPPLLPPEIEDRFTARELAYAVATELHAPLNLPVLNYLKDEFGADKAAIGKWYRHWLTRTLTPVERRLEALGAGDFLFDTPGLFEIVIVPQLYNARRFDYEVEAHPHLARIEAASLALDAFSAAHPDNQPDNPKETE